jgi:hypothetical protein
VGSGRLFWHPAFLLFTSSCNHEGVLLCIDPFVFRNRPLNPNVAPANSDRARLDSLCITVLCRWNRWRIGGYLYSGSKRYYSHLAQSITITAPDPPVGHWSGTYTNAFHDTFPVNSFDVIRDSNGQTYSGSGSMVVGIYNPYTLQLVSTRTDPISLSNGHYNSATGVVTGTVTDTTIPENNSFSGKITQSTSGGITHWTMTGQFVNNIGDTLPFTMTKASNLTLQPTGGIARASCLAGRWTRSRRMPWPRSLPRLLPAGRRRACLHRTSAGSSG